MIGLSELRASAWKYSCIVVAVLAVAAGVTAVVFRGDAAAADRRADAAESRAEASDAIAKSLMDAMSRDSASAVATEAARAAMEESAAQINSRFAALEASIRGRPPVPATCPDPDPGLVREHQAGTARVHAAEDRLRGIRSSKGQDSVHP